MKVIKGTINKLIELIQEQEIDMRIEDKDLVKNMNFFKRTGDENDFFFVDITREVFKSGAYNHHYHHCYSLTIHFINIILYCKKDYLDFLIVS